MPDSINTRISSCSKHGSFTSRLLFARKNLSLWSQCEQCENEKNNRQLQHSRQQQIESNLSKSEIPKRFLNKTLDNFIADTPEKEYALDVARSFASKFSEHSEKGSSLIFAGGIGTGKTHLATAICNQVVLQGYNVCFSTVKEFILTMRAGWSDRKATSELEVLRMLTTVPLLVIDEVGVQFSTEAERDQLFSVINGRYLNMLPTILTANLTKSEFQKTIGDRSFSRLREDGRWIVFDWEDFRCRL